MDTIRTDGRRTAANIRQRWGSHRLVMEVRDALLDAWIGDGPGGREFTRGMVDALTESESVYLDRLLEEATI